MRRRPTPTTRATRPTTARRRPGWWARGRRGAPAAALAGALLLAACDPASDPPETDGVEEPDDDLEPVAPEPADDPRDDDAPTDGADAPGETPGAAPLDADASAEDRDEPNDGADLTVTDVRVGTHEGFDRVTVELGGDATVGWFAGWTDQAIEDGSGRTVDVGGDAVLTLAVRGVLLPFDRPDDVEAWDGETVTAATGSDVLVEVVEGVLFEGQQQLFLGTEREVPFRIARLDDPQRIVIDLEH